MRRRRQLLGSAIYWAWLSGFAVVFAALWRVSPQGLLESFRDVAGLIGLIMTVVLVAPLLAAHAQEATESALAPSGRSSDPQPGPDPPG